MKGVELWRREQQYLCAPPSIGLQLDIARMKFDGVHLDHIAEPMRRALAAMDEPERGAKANVDEDRMVAHYWLRAPTLAPTDAIRAGIEQAIVAVKRFADEIPTGTIRP